MPGLEAPSSKEFHDPNGWLDEQRDEVTTATPEAFTLPESFKEFGRAAISGTAIFESHKEFDVADTSEIHRDTKERFTVPRGWTTLIHGTDTMRWELGDPVKVVKGGGLSAITAEDAAKDKELAVRLNNPGAYDTTRSYARARSEAAESVEVRVVFYREDLATQRVPAADVADIKAALSLETQSLITKYHQPRHAVIPRNEQLIRLGQASDDGTGRHIEYFVPRSVAADYLEAVARESVA